MSVGSDIARVWADAGVHGWLHARPIGASPEEVAIGADTPVPLASVYKLAVLVAFVRAVDAGDIDPTERTELDPVGRTPGPTGIGALADPVTASWRDLAALMVTLSDNAAADALLIRLSVPAVARAMAEVGLPGVRVVGGTAGVLADLQAETATGSVAAALDAIADLDAPLEPSAYDPLRTSVASARDLTALLAAVWDGTAASPAGCAFARRLLAARVGPARIRAGFPLDAVAVADKTGTLGALRHDVGVVTWPSGPPVAVAVLTRAARVGPVMAGVDAAIGAAARLAVDHLRASARRSSGAAR